MLIEICIASYGLYLGSKKNKKKKVHAQEKKIQSVSEKKVIVAPQTEIYEFEKEVNQSVRLSLACVGIASAGALFFPPLSLFAGAFMLYLGIPMFKQAKQAIFEERRVRIDIFDAVGFLVLVGSGYFVAGSLAVLAYNFAVKLRLNTENKTRQNLINVFGEQPRTVWVLKEQVEIEVPFESLQQDDIVVVNPGEAIPADGRIIQGIASIDQHMLTGESQAAEKEVGDQVFAATMMISGKIQVQVEKAGQATVAAKIGEILQGSADFTASLELDAQRLADASVIPAFALAAVAAPFVGVGGVAALLCSNFLINMKMLSPLSMLTFLSIASKEGILIKDGRSLQSLSEVDTVVFDKTGTLTLEQPYVGHIYTFRNIKKDTVLSYAAAAEYRQTHPIALAILEEAEKCKLTLPEIKAANYKIGYGIIVTIGKKVICVGSERFMESEKIMIPQTFNEKAKNSYEQGNTLIYVAVNKQLIGVIEMKPTIRPEAKRVIKKLRKRHMRFYIISGDHVIPTKKIAELLDIDHYFAQVLPDGKAQLIEELQASGKKVCFIGDGINDAIALKKANVSISMRGASSIATDTAQIVLMDQTLSKLPDIFDIAYDFKDNMKHTFLATVTPAAVGIAGVLFAKFKVVNVVMLYIISLTSAFGITMLPAMKKQRENDKADIKRIALDKNKKQL